MNDKIPWHRFRGEKYDLDENVSAGMRVDSDEQRILKREKVFAEMRAVSLEDLQSLSRNELDAIPMVWLNDWAHVSGLMGCKDVQDWLDTLKARRERPRVVQIGKKQSAVKFAGYIGGRYLFELKYKSGTKKCELYDKFCFVDGKRLTLTDEQMSRFRDAYQRFEKDLQNGRERREGFHCAQKDGITVYFRRLRSSEWKYQFITQLENGDLRQEEMRIGRYFADCKFLGIYNSSRGSRRHSFDSSDSAIDDGFILFYTDDEYLNKELKYLYNRESKEDVEFLNSIDGFPRLYVDKEIYGVEDITVTKVERIPPTYRHQYVEYTVYFTLNGKEYASYTYDNCNRINVHCHAKLVSLRIDEEVRRVIERMIEELPYDERCDLFKRRGHTSFATVKEDGKSNLLEKVLHKFGLDYQKIFDTRKENTENAFLIWNTAYASVPFDNVVKKLNELFLQRKIVRGYYLRQKYVVSLWDADEVGAAEYQEVDGCEADDVVEGLNRFYLESKEEPSVRLGELQQSGGAAASPTVNGGYVRAARVDMLMKCIDASQLEKATCDS